MKCMWIHKRLKNECYLNIVMILYYLSFKLLLNCRHDTNCFKIQQCQTKKKRKKKENAADVIWVMTMFFLRPPLIPFRPSFLSTSVLPLLVHMAVLHPHHPSHHQPPPSTTSHHHSTPSPSPSSIMTTLPSLWCARMYNWRWDLFNTWRCGNSWAHNWFWQAAFKFLMATSCLKIE